MLWRHYWHHGVGVVVTGGLRQYSTTSVTLVQSFNKITPVHVAHVSMDYLCHAKDLLWSASPPDLFLVKHVWDVNLSPVPICRILRASSNNTGEDTRLYRGFKGVYQYAY